MSTGFKDNFSKQSQVYAKFRPAYPPELFSYLAALCRAHELAWDCGTGNGQSALSLAAYFKTVYATDPSAEQLQHALPHERITYNVEKAESSSLKDLSADLVTVAQAVHWFDLDRFYTEVKRVLKPGGILAVWAYGLPSISESVDPVIRYFHDEVLGDFWQKENRLIEQEYRPLFFPFEPLAAPELTMHKIITREDLIGLLHSWSAVQRYKDFHHTDPVKDLEAQLENAWPDPDVKQEASWKLILKAGRKT